MTVIETKCEWFHLVPDGNCVPHSSLQTKDVDADADADADADYLCGGFCLISPQKVIKIRRDKMMP